MNKTQLLDRFAPDGESRTLLGRCLDQLELARQRGVPACTPFLSPAQRAMVEDMLPFAAPQRHAFFGGYEGAERTVCCFLADWQEEDSLLWDEEGPLAALEAAYAPDAGLTHRDLLGSLMGLGLTREKIGDILVGEGKSQVVVLRQALPILMSQWESAGRWRLTLRPVPLTQLTPPPRQVKVFRDTVAALRLDAVVASAFSTSRSKAADLIRAGRVELNHRPALKGDRGVAQGDTLSCRGLGKCVVREVLGESKKGRIMLELERWL